MPKPLPPSFTVPLYAEGVAPYLPTEDEDPEYRKARVSLLLDAIDAATDEAVELGANCNAGCIRVQVRVARERLTGWALVLREEA